MSATTSTTAATRAATTTPVRRLRALGRAELALLGRNRSAVVTALLVPLALPFSVRPAVDQMDLKGRGCRSGR